MDQLSGIFTSSLERAPWGWGLLVLLIGALVKVWPVIQLQVYQAREKMRGERRDDLDTCRERMDALDVRLTATEEKAHRFEIQLTGALAAYGIVEAELENLNPSSLSLVQAKAILTATFKVSPVPQDMSDTLSRAN